MTKRKAKARIDAGDITWGELKTMLRCEMGAPARVSTVNKGLSHEHAVEILARAIENRPDEAIAAGPNRSSFAAETSRTPHLDRLTVVNILRECA
jgi:hypothetical protein